jgi:hypothetical protein
MVPPRSAGRAQRAEAGNESHECSKTQGIAAQTSLPVLPKLPPTRQDQSGVLTDTSGNHASKYE